MLASGDGRDSHKLVEVQLPINFSVHCETAVLPEYHCADL